MRVVKVSLFEQIIHSRIAAGISLRCNAYKRSFCQSLQIFRSLEACLCIIYQTNIAAFAVNPANTNELVAKTANRTIIGFEID